MTEARVALLIDADNLSGDVISQAIEHLLKSHGAIHFRRAYCSPQKVIEHMELFRRHSIRPMVNVPTGKNSTDIALAVDAIDLVISERPAVVVIASSDSDYAPLAQRLREKGCRVIGIGQAGKTGGESPLAYDEFIDLAHRKARAAPRAGAVSVPTARRVGVAAPAPAKGLRAPVAPAEPFAAAPVSQPLSGSPARPRAASTRSRGVASVASVADVASVAGAAALAKPPAMPAMPAASTAPVAAVAAVAAVLPAEVASILMALPALAKGVALQLGEVGEALRKHGILKSKSASPSGCLKRHKAHFELVPIDKPRTVRYLGTPLA